MRNLNVITLVLGGGRGTRLYPLTKFRSKPAVPLGGKFRLIDIPLSNCINSGLNRIYVLTQFMSVSLHRHIRRTYYFDAFSGGFVEVLAAQQTLVSNDWFQGTADAVRQHIRYINQSGIDLVLILSGDQLYRMDYRDLINTHMESSADVTIAALPVNQEMAGGLGIMRIDNSGRVVGFLEKPKTTAEIDLVRMDPHWLDSHGVESRGRDCLASMGIYLFKRETLVELLEKTEYQDFGKEIFPASIRTRQVQVHLYDDYWEDIGTIKAFFDSNLDLAKPSAPFNLFQAEAPIYSRARFLPPSRIDSATIHNSLIADGCIVEPGATIENSIIGLRSIIGRNCVIRNSVIMGADVYEDQALNGHTPLGIGAGSLVEGAIIDKNVRIGRECRITNPDHIVDSEEFAHGMVRDGIPVITKDAIMKDGGLF